MHKALSTPRKSSLAVLAGGLPVDLGGREELGDVGLAGGAGLGDLALPQRAAGAEGAILNVTDALAEQQRVYVVLLVLMQ